MTFLMTLLWMSALASQTEMSTIVPDEYWRNPRRCGLNCLYVYMNIHGQQRTLGEIASRLELGPMGASLEDMRRVATALGVPSKVVRLVNDDLSYIPLPAICHTDIRGGHFQVLLEINDDVVTTADTSSGEIVETNRNDFLENWSGFLLLPRGNRRWKLNFQQGTALALIVSSALVFLKISRSHRSIIK